ncbi:hypothetical protein EDD86DRAFT_273200 [Gorgonomyces haynaldii]|nr:hypothetical protein EDD86DRAFT_273200 [Gorgonomyces haynaldii]
MDFILDAFSNVKANVPSWLLAIPESQFRPETPEKPIYNANPLRYCYWPLTNCIKSMTSLSEDTTYCSTQTDWGLSFDRGPFVTTRHRNDTIALLRFMKAQDLRATFFLQGTRAIIHRDTVTDLYMEGNEIGVSSWTGRPMTTLSNLEIVAEIKFIEALVYEYLGVVPRLFRPPYGDLDDRVRAIAQALGYQIVLWSKNAKDVLSEGKGGVISQHFESSPSGMGLLMEALIHKPPGLNVLPVGACIDKPSYRNENVW